MAAQLLASPAECCCTSRTIPAQRRSTVHAQGVSRAVNLRLQRSAFTGACSPLSVVKPLQRRAETVVRAMIREYPDPDFIAEVMEEFPDKGVATVEEARVLYANGYTYLDVRPDLELDLVGKFKGSVNIPIMNSVRKWSSEEQKKVVEKTENPNFVAQVEKKFPDKDTPLLIGCSDGRTYAMDALVALDEAGYTHLVGLRGGFYAWYKVFDNNLRRRRTGEYAEQYTHDGDSCGIHSSGAGFARVDSIEAWTPPAL